MSPTVYLRSLPSRRHIDNVTATPLQVKCQGIGSFLKIVVREKPKRSQHNPYSQVSLSSIKVGRSYEVWGRLTGYDTQIKNKFVTATKDRTRLNKLLLEMGVSAEVLNWYEDSDVDYKNLPIDEQTKITLHDIDAIREKYLEKEDFEAMKRITIDIKKVIILGRRIFSLQTELEFEIAKQNYQRSIELKEEIRKLDKERDMYDAKYETSRYEQMISLKRPVTADMNNNFDDLPDEEVPFEPPESERSRLDKTVGSF